MGRPSGILGNILGNFLGHIFCIAFATMLFGVLISLFIIFPNFWAKWGDASGVVFSIFLVTPSFVLARYVPIWRYVHTALGNVTAVVIIGTFHLHNIFISTLLLAATIFLVSMGHFLGGKFWAKPSPKAEDSDSIFV